MELQNILSDLSLAESPSGLGGCKAHGTTFDCCEYNVTVFDGKESPAELVESGDALIKIQHGKLGETNPDTLQRYMGMTVIQDDQWELKMLLSAIEEKSPKIVHSCVRGCLVEAALCATKAKQQIDGPFAPAWVKSSAYYIADALVLHNKKQRSPTHMLEFIRRSQKRKENEFSVVADAIGLERATPSLLERMVKSTIGFSDMTENAGSSKIIQRKYRYLSENSLLSDCYFYLGYMNKSNFALIRDSLHKKQEMVHVLKTAFDFEHDPSKLESQATSLHKLANELMASLQ